MVEHKERRRHPRYACDTGVQFHPENGRAGAWGTLSDISLGGCYIYTFAPLPTGEAVALLIKANGKEINVSGKTVSSHPGVGMGIAFEGFLQKDGQATLQAFVDHLASLPKTSEHSGVFH
jgi:hypothetical protein